MRSNGSIRPGSPLMVPYVTIVPPSVRIRPRVAVPPPHTPSSPSLTGAPPTAAAILVGASSESTTTTSAPSASISATDACLRTMLIVRRPRVRAIATRARPTPEPPALSAIQSPGRRPTCSSSRSAAVGGLMLSMDACCASMPRGSTTRPPAGATTRWAQANVPLGSRTASPTATPSTPSPRVTTTPAPSLPITDGRGGRTAYIPRASSRSLGMIGEKPTWIRTSPGPGPFGSGISTCFRPVAGSP